MPLEMALNELSVSPVDDAYAARALMATLADTLEALFDKGFRMLRVGANYFETPLAPEYTLTEWMYDQQADIESRRFVISFVTRSPVLDEADGTSFAESLGSEVLYSNKPGVGLGAAYLLDGLALSFQRPDWDAPVLDAVLRVLTEQGDLEDESIKVVHASRRFHVEANSRWILSRAARGFDDGAQLWENRAGSFPRLVFCARVEDQLRGISSGDPRLPQVIRKLIDFNEYCENWHGGAFDCDGLPCKVTGESGPTLKQYAQEHTFLCPDGQHRLFAWHVRFTPGPGRIFFEPLPGERSIMVGHIGKKLPTVLYGT